MATRQKKPPTDPYVEAQIERALGRYKGKMSPEMLAAMRERLEEMLTTHPVAVGLLEQLRKTPVPASSGDRPVEGCEEDEDAEKGA
jgi:hypothetical protein